MKGKGCPFYERRVMVAIKGRKNLFDLCVFVVVCSHQSTRLPGLSFFFLCCCCYFPRPAPFFYPACHTPPSPPLTFFFTPIAMWIQCPAHPRIYVRAPTHAHAKKSIHALDHPTPSSTQTRQRIHRSLSRSPYRYPFLHHSLSLFSQRSQGCISALHFLFLLPSLRVLHPNHSPPNKTYKALVIWQTTSFSHSRSRCCHFYSSY